MQGGSAGDPLFSTIKDAREGKYPELELKSRIDELHNIAARLKQKLDLAQAGMGFSFFQRLLVIGVEPDRLEEVNSECRRTGWKVM